MSQKTKKISLDQLRLGQTDLDGEVLVNGKAVPDAVGKQLHRVVVDLHVGLPDSFEITFRDPMWNVLADAGLGMGKVVEVRGTVPNEDGTFPLIKGEVTSIEGSYGDRASFTIVRGYTRDHRLQRVRRTRTFLNIKDSDLAKKVAQEAGLKVGVVESTTVDLPEVTQDNQTDWQLLRERAEEIGYEVGVVDDEFYFRKASSTTGTAVSVMCGLDLLRFSPRVTASGLVDEVEVRAWDPVQAKAVAAKKPIAASGIEIGVKPDETARLFATGGAAPAAASGDLGPAPSPKAFVVSDRAICIDSNNTQALTNAALAVAERTSSGFAEAEGELIGNANVVAGAVLQVAGGPSLFQGKWTVSSARHDFDCRPGGAYRTSFTVNGRQDRSLLALGEGGGNNRGPTRIQGVVGGVVSSLDDPLGLGRVRVALPWLSPDYVSPWAPVIQLTAGKGTGALFLPEAGDQVLVSFEFGDLRRPYVLGSVMTPDTGAGAALIDAGDKKSPGAIALGAGKPPPIVKRGFVSPNGNRLLFHDEAPPGGGTPTTDLMVLATKEDKIGLSIDGVAGTLTLSCKPSKPPGTLVIECDGNVEIKAAPTGSMLIDGGSELTLKGKTVKIEAAAMAEVKGKTVNVEGTGPVAVKGKPIQLN